MAFMQPDITDSQEWLEVDGNNGTEFVPGDLLNLDELRAAIAAEDMDRVAELAEPFLETMEVREAKITTGYGYRLSAPGYMDCTTWSVYETLADAEAARDEEAEDDTADDGDDEEMPPRTAEQNAARALADAEDA